MNTHQVASNKLLLVSNRSRPLASRGILAMELHDFEEARVSNRSRPLASRGTKLTQGKYHVTLFPIDRVP